MRSKTPRQAALQQAQRQGETGRGVAKDAKRQCHIYIAFFFARKIPCVQEYSLKGGGAGKDLSTKPLPKARDLQYFPAPVPRAGRLQTLPNLGQVHLPDGGGPGRPCRGRDRRHSGSQQPPAPAGDSPGGVVPRTNFPVTGQGQIGRRATDGLGLIPVLAAGFKCKLTLPSRIRPYGPKGDPGGAPGRPRRADAKRAGLGAPGAPRRTGSPGGLAAGGPGLPLPPRSSCSERRRGARRKRRRKGTARCSPSPYRVVYPPHQDAEQRIAGPKELHFLRDEVLLLGLVLLARTEDPRLGSPWPPPLSPPPAALPRPGTRPLYTPGPGRQPYPPRRRPRRAVSPHARRCARPAQPAVPAGRAGEEGCARLAPWLGSRARPPAAPRPASRLDQARRERLPRRRRHDGGAEGARAAAAAPPAGAAAGPLGAAPSRSVSVAAAQQPWGRRRAPEVAPRGPRGRWVGVRRGEGENPRAASWRKERSGGRPGGTGAPQRRRSAKKGGLRAAPLTRARNGRASETFGTLWRPGLPLAPRESSTALAASRSGPAVTLLILLCLYPSGLLDPELEPSHKPAEVRLLSAAALSLPPPPTPSL